MAFPLRQAVVLFYLFLISSKEVSSDNDHIHNDHGLQNELRFIRQEIGLLKEENRKQNKDIIVLHDIIQLQNKTINQHEATIKELDQEIKKSCNGCKQNHDSSEKHEQSKRPARLLPLQLLFDRDEDEDTTKKPPPRKFYGPPTNCSDLSRLGYTLNGYYLVRNSYKDTMTNNNFNSNHINTVETVYCAFKQEGTFSPSLVEQKLALSPHILELKKEMAQVRRLVKTPYSSESYIGTPYTSTVICFTVQKIISNQPTGSSIIQFEEEVVNLGESFDIKKSIFIAPKEGIYEFVFTGYKRGMNKEHDLKVSLRLNGKAVGNALAEELVSVNTEEHNVVHNFHCPISMYTLLKLKKGDQIDVFKSQGNFQTPDSHRPIHFSGKLLFNEDDQNHSQKSHKAVYFVLQKTIGFNSSNSVVPFEMTSLNVGGSFDQKKNAFIVPVSGIYEFTLKGYKVGDYDSVEISLRVNGKAMANSWADWARYHEYHSQFSISTILEVDRGDAVDVYLAKGQIYDNDNQYTTFSGKLLLMSQNSFSNTIPKFHSSDVIFNVQKTADFSNMYNIVPFEKEVLNAGQAFNMSESTFTAPRGGIYEFRFLGLKTARLMILSVALRLNGNSVTYASAENLIGHSFHTPFYLQCILKMEKGDRVDLFLEEGAIGDDDNQFTHFTGKLLFAINENQIK